MSSGSEEDDQRVSHEDEPRLSSLSLRDGSRGQKRTYVGQEVVNLISPPAAWRPVDPSAECFINRQTSLEDGGEGGEGRCEGETEEGIWRGGGSREEEEDKAHGAGPPHKRGQDNPETRAFILSVWMIQEAHK